MRARIWLVAALAAASTTLALTELVVAPHSQAAVSPAVACTAPPWTEGTTYPAGDQVTYQSHQYRALVTHTAYPGAGWNPAATPSLWQDLGACSGGGTSSPSPTRTASPTTSPTRTASPTPTPTTGP